MSKSDSWRYFASDGQIFRSVGRLELILKTMELSNAATTERARATGRLGLQMGDSGAQCTGRAGTTKRRFLEDLGESGDLRIGRGLYTP